MSFYSIVKSTVSSFFFGESKTNEANQNKDKSTNSATNVTANQPIFTQAKVQKSDGHSGSNGQASTDGGGNDFTNTVKKDVRINIKEMTKKYKDNPLDVLRDPILGKEFTPEEAAEMEKLLKNKGDLKSYLELAKKGNLSNKDIIEGMKELDKNKVIDWWIIHWNKLDKEELAGNMSDIRVRRKDSKSRNVAHLGGVMTKSPELKESAMHFVSKTKLYNEQNVMDAVDYMDNNKSKSLKFFKNTVDLENIKQENGAEKYKGDTIIHTSKGMTENEGLSTSIYNTALKKDMNDEYLVNITDDLIKNPIMQSSYDQFLSMKGSSGNDRFSAKNLSTQTKYMSDKTSVQIQCYRENTVELAQYGKMSGDNVVNTAGNVTDHPQTRSEIISMVKNDKYSGDDVSDTSSKLAQSTQYAENNNKVNSTDNTKYSDSKKSQSQYANASESHLETLSAVFSKPENPQARQKYEDFFQNKNDLEYLATIVKKDPKVVDSIRILYNNPNIPSSRIVSIMKQYGNNPTLLGIYCKDPDYFDKNPSLLKVYAKNPDYFEKLNAFATLTNAQKEQFAKFADSSSKDLVFTMLNNKISPSKVLSMLTSASTDGSQESIKRLMANNTISTFDKIKSIEENKADKARELTMA